MECSTRFKKNYTSYINPNQNLFSKFLISFFKLFERRKLSIGIFNVSQQQTQLSLQPVVYFKSEIDALPNAHTAHRQILSNDQNWSHTCQLPSNDANSCAILVSTERFHYHLTKTWLKDCVQEKLLIGGSPDINESSCTSEIPDRLKSNFSFVMIAKNRRLTLVVIHFCLHISLHRVLLALSVMTNTCLS